MDRRTELIRERAYRIWIEEGEPEGREEEHWAQAEREIDEAGDLDVPRSEAAGPIPLSQADLYTGGVGSGTAQDA